MRDPRPPLTPRQTEMLEHIRRLTAQHGHPPTIRELGDAMGIRGTNAVTDHFVRLERGGYITRRKGLSRSVCILPTPSPTPPPEAPTSEPDTNVIVEARARLSRARAVHEGFKRRVAEATQRVPKLMQRITEDQRELQELRTSLATSDIEGREAAQELQAASDALRTAYDWKPRTHGRGTP